MIAPQPWMADALCAQTDPEAFFPEQGQSSTEARAVCSRCEVATQCLTFALEHDEYGIWGGLSETARRKLKPSGPPRRRVTETDAERQAVLDAYRAGTSPAQIAAETGLSRGHVDRLIGEAGIRRSRSEAQQLAAARRKGAA